MLEKYGSALRPGWGKYMGESVPLLVTYACPTDFLCWPAWCQRSQGGGKCNPSCFLKDFFSSKAPAAVLPERRNMVWEDVGGREHKASERGQESGSEVCRCLMGVLPGRPEIIVCSEKPCEGGLHGRAGGKRACAADPQRGNKCVRAPGFGPAVVPWSTVLMVEE